MRAFFGGLGVGLALAVAAALVGVQLGLVTLEAGAAVCDAGCCGADTRWEGGHCVPVGPELASEDEDDDAPKKRRRRGRRGGRGAGSADAGATPEAKIVDDSRVPRFDPRADRTIELGAGSERLSDQQIDRAMSALDPAFRRCVEAASEAGDLGRGRVKLEFGVAGSGKVTGVNVTAPAAMVRLGLVPCVRVALHRHHFPTFDGPVMTVRSSFSVD